MRRRRVYHFAIIFSTICFLLVAPRCSALSPDGLSLLAFKEAVSDDPSSSLAGWSEVDDNPCRWPGVSCANVAGSAFPRVVAIAVSGKNLSGYIPSELGSLFYLRRLNLHGNRLSGPVPAQLFNASSLHSVFLYDNRLSGPLPAAVCDVPRLQNLDLSRNALAGPLPWELRRCRQMQRLILAGNRLSSTIPDGIWAEMAGLVQLDLSSNAFEGPIPPDLGALDSLGGTLNLSHNRFSGTIPRALGNLPSMVSLDLRYNNLTGEIPGVGSLSNQGPTAFLNNPGLCGFPLLIPCGERAATAPGTPGAMQGSAVAAGMGGARADEATAGEGGRGMRAWLIVLISAADAGGVALVGLVVVCAYWKVKDRDRGCAKLGRGGSDDGGSYRRWRSGWCWGAGMAEKGEGGGFSSSDEEGEEEGGGAEGKLVSMDKGFKVELEELLRASAYVLGKGAKGIVYKVVVGEGAAVAVRRLGDVGGRYKEFAAEVRAMGRVHHPNVAKLRAYYWAPDEKLLITDFIANGSLAAALRGRSGQPSLTWPMRLRIARGAARGLAHLHDCSARKLVHGDLKTSNILLDADFTPYISDFGLLRLLSLAPSASFASSAASSSTGLLGAALPPSAQSSHIDIPSPYRAPETRVTATGAAARLTQKSDVYSFGVVLLEMLTGKPPEISSPSPPASSGDQLPGLVRWVRKGFEEARPLSELIDPALLHDTHAKKEAAAAFHIALACTAVDPEVRARMKTVSENLDRIGK